MFGGFPFGGGWFGGWPTVAPRPRPTQRVHPFAGTAQRNLSAPIVSLADSSAGVRLGASRAGVRVAACAGWRARSGGSLFAAATGGSRMSVTNEN